jgi:hypothetical protein
MLSISSLTADMSDSSTDRTTFRASKILRFIDFDILRFGKFLERRVIYACSSRSVLISLGWYSSCPSRFLIIANSPAPNNFPFVSQKRFTPMSHKNRQ